MKTRRSKKLQTTQPKDRREAVAAVRRIAAPSMTTA
jgi:hypothetical protein